MKKHTEKLANIPASELAKTATALRTEIADLKRGIRMGEVQNYKVIPAKKRELARVLTRMNIKETVSNDASKEAK